MPPDTPALPPPTAGEAGRLTPTVASRYAMVRELDLAFAEADGDDARNRLLPQLNRTILALARETAFTPADSAAKLRVLLRDLRDDLHPDDPQRLRWYLLAETALEGLGVAAQAMQHS